MALESQEVRVSPGLGARILDGGRRFLEGDVFHSFRRSPTTMIAAAVTLLLFLVALLAPWIAPYNTMDLSSINLMDPPIGSTFDDSGFIVEADPRFLLGTDEQGRDLLSAIIFGLRISLEVGFASVVLAAVFGTLLGLISGYVGGKVDSVIMRIADIQLTFPAILIALLIDGVSRGFMNAETHQAFKLPILILAIAASQWVNFARTVRGSTLVEKGKEYVQAARVIGIHPILIMLRHVLPNVTGPVLVIATLTLAIAILTEATLSFLGVGVPATEPSLGTLIRLGQGVLFSGIWWLTIFPSVVLVVLVLAVHLLGDWLRDALNPRLR
jgi:peptide/nickel transport system permease protein